jgi:hypothetical protein
MKTTPRFCEILGHKIDLEKIRNPRIRNVIRERHDEFIFSYGDAKASYEDSTSYHYHTDNVSYPDYSERSSHSDESKGKSGYREHIDRTTHSDSPYSDKYPDFMR